jgi:hypothetical protein
MRAALLPESRRTMRASPLPLVQKKCMESAKGADARRQTGWNLLAPWGGALDPAPVLREFLQRNPEIKELFGFLVIGARRRNARWWRSRVNFYLTG